MASPIHCLLDDPRCFLSLPDGGIDHPDPGRNPGSGKPNDDGVNKDTRCAPQRAALGAAANTPFGMQLLASIGCP